MSAQVKCRILRETEAAYKIHQETPNREPVITWIPISQCDHSSKGPKALDGSRDAIITMPEWLADEKGLRSE